MRFLFAIILLGVSVFAMGETPSTPNKLSHDSEASVILASGNSETQTYSVKQVTGYDWSQNTAKLSASYLLGKTSGTETAKKWDAGLKYERSLSKHFSVFSSYQIDSLPFAGTDLRHTFDLGGKYTFLKSDSQTFDSELGYRITKENFTNDNGKSSFGYLTSHMSRLYIEWTSKWSPALSSKLWGEYLQSYTNTKDYRFNLEPSLSMLLNEVFSIKLAYLVNFRNVPAVEGKKTVDTLYTTSLVAKF